MADGSTTTAKGSPRKRKFDAEERDSPSKKQKGGKAAEDEKVEGPVVADGHGGDDDWLV